MVFQRQDTPSVVESSAGESQTVPSGSVSAGPNISQNSPTINSELFFMIEQLQQEVRSLRGLVEEQQHLLNRLQKDGKSRYKDLDDRLLSLTKQVNTNKPAPQVVVPATSIETNLAQVNTDVPATTQKTVTKEPTAEQRKAYQDAYAFIKEKKFDEAIDGLHQFLEKYPEGELAGNAYYWLGEVYLVLPKLEQARQSFSIVAKTFPNHRKVADALFKLGVTYDRMQDPEQSERYLNQVQVEFPESTAAKLARSYKINR